jgi:hypothetical protein
MGVRLGDRDGLAERVAGADPGAEFEFEIEIPGRARMSAPSHRAACAGLAGGAPGWARAHRGGPAVIGDGDVLVVRHQRIFGSQPFAAVAGVVDAGEEIGVVADLRGQMQRAVGTRPERLWRRAREPTPMLRPTTGRIACRAVRPARRCRGRGSR